MTSSRGAGVGLGGNVAAVVADKIGVVVVVGDGAGGDMMMMTYWLWNDKGREDFYYGPQCYLEGLLLMTMAILTIMVMAVVYFAVLVVVVVDVVAVVAALDADDDAGIEGGEEDDDDAGAEDNWSDLKTSCVDSEMMMMKQTDGIDVEVLGVDVVDAVDADEVDGCCGQSDNSMRVGTEADAQTRTNCHACWLFRNPVHSYDDGVLAAILDLDSDPDNRFQTEKWKTEDRVRKPRRR